jgi:biotin transport system permease protein
MTLLARIPVSIKFAVLFVAGIGLYLITSWQLMVGFLALAVAAVLLTGVPPRRLARPVLGLVIIIGVVVIMTGLTTGWPAALINGLRLITLCLLAYAVSLSTRFAEMLQLFERVLAPTARFGLNPARISLALSLTVRFIPQLRTTYLQVREAQYARGLQNRPLATLVPMIIRTLQSAEQIAEAIDARAYDTRGEL